MKNFKTIFSKYKKQANIKTQYDKHWGNIVKHAENANKPELRLVAHGAWYVLSTSETPVADMSKMLTLEPSIMTRVRMAGEVLIKYKELTAPKKKPAAKKKATPKKTTAKKTAKKEKKKEEK